MVDSCFLTNRVMYLLQANTDRLTKNFNPKIIVFLYSTLCCTTEVLKEFLAGSSNFSRLE